MQKQIRAQNPPSVTVSPLYRPLRKNAQTHHQEGHQMYSAPSLRNLSESPLWKAHPPSDVRCRHPIPCPHMTDPASHPVRTHSSSPLQTNGKADCRVYVEVCVPRHRISHAWRLDRISRTRSPRVDASPCACTGLKPPRAVRCRRTCGRMQVRQDSDDYDNPLSEDPRRSRGKEYVREGFPKGSRYV